MSYYNQILSADRDQTSTENALKSFERMNREFPANPHSQEAENLMLRCRTRLADHEVYVRLVLSANQKISAGPSSVWKRR